jgi:DNA-directed RNA polymerase subunit RPC12/RpoP
MHVPEVTEKRKKRACNTEESHSCADNDEKPIDPSINIEIGHHSSFENNINDPDCRLHVPESNSTEESHRCANNDEKPVEQSINIEIGHHSSFENNINDPDCRVHVSQSSSTEEFFSCSDNDENSIEPCINSEIGRHRNSENHSNNPYLTAIPRILLLLFGNNDRSSHDDEPGCDDEREVTGHTPMEYSTTDRGGNSFFESFLETEGEAREVEVSTSSREPCAAPTTEDGNSGAVPSPSTSSEAAAHTSDCRNEQSQTPPGCPICLVNFTTQEVATTDTCNHIFCATCLLEWSHYVTTCPVDRQVFHVIHVRHRLDGEVVRTIHVESIRQEMTFCIACGEPDHEDRMVLCNQCSFACHLACLRPPLDAPPEDGWLCPYCFFRILVSLTEEVATRLGIL